MPTLLFTSWVSHSADRMWGPGKGCLTILLASFFFVSLLPSPGTLFFFPSVPQRVGDSALGRNPVFKKMLCLGKLSCNQGTRRNPESFFSAGRTTSITLPQVAFQGRCSVSCPPNSKNSDLLNDLRVLSIHPGVGFNRPRDFCLSGLRRLLPSTAATV